MVNAELMDIVIPQTGKIGAEIRGIDARELEADAPEWEQIRQLVYRHKLVVLRGQTLAPHEYVELAYKLGRPQIYFQKNYHHPDHPEIFVSSNVNKPGEKIGVSGTGRYWHTDCSFQDQPLSWTSVYPVIFPPSARKTFYIDMQNVYNRLPAHLKAVVEGATTQHAAQLRYKVQASDIDKSLQELLDRMNEEAPPVLHPAVITHPVTGDRILYINSGFTTRIQGYRHEENVGIMQELFEFVEREEHVHTHVWEDGDLIIWDNRYLIHKASSVPKGESSKSYRIGIYDGHPFYAGLEP